MPARQERESIHGRPDKTDPCQHFVNIQHRRTPRQSGKQRNRARDPRGRGNSNIGRNSGQTQLQGQTETTGGPSGCDTKTPARHSTAPHRLSAMPAPALDAIGLAKLCLQPLREPPQPRGRTSQSPRSKAQAFPTRTAGKTLAIKRHPLRTCPSKTIAQSTSQTGVIALQRAWGGRHPWPRDQRAQSKHR